MDHVYQWAAWGLLGAAGVGLLLSFVHLIILRWHLRGPVPTPSVRPPISILKPLCGVDDRLERNLAVFAALPYPSYEVLLGVRDVDDAAYPAAKAAARRWPSRFRVVVQSSEPGLTAAKILFGKDYVVGKSMALRWRDVRALGGFGVVKDVLAEDFVLGRMIPERLGKRVVLGRSVVRCVSVRRSVEGFVKRYARWSVMQHQCAGLPAYWGMLLLNPQWLTTLALCLSPGRGAVAAWLACAAARIGLDAAAGRVLRGRTFALWALPWAPIKDLLAAGAWLYGLTSRSIEWRSTRLRVLRGSVLAPAPLALGRRRSGSDRDPASATA